MSNRTILSRLVPAAALLAAGFMPAPALAGLAIENVTFQRSTNIGYDGNSPVDEGGGLFVLVRNTGSEMLDLTSESMTINGTPVTTIMTQGPNAPTPGWVRVWPESIGPGEAATWTLKTFGGTVVEGATLASIEVQADSGATATATDVLVQTPKLRFGHVVPEPDMRGIRVFLRNDDDTPLTVSELWINDEVTDAAEFVGGATVQPGEVLIAKVAYDEPVQLLKPMALRASATRAADSATVEVGAFMRLAEAEYGITTWGSSPSNDVARVQRVRELYGLTGNSWGAGLSPILVTKSTQYFYRQRMLDVLDMLDNDTVDMSNAAIVEQFAGTGIIGAWFVEDEPDLRFGNPIRNPRAMMNLSRAYWRMDPGTPTHLNLVSSRSAQSYALTVDNPALDAYMQYAPRHFGGLTNTYEIREVLDQTDNMKRVAEPVRIWMTPQGVSPGTWGTQPTPWGIAIQFWAQVAGGAKGLDGFKFDDTVDSSSDPGGVRTQRIIDLIRQLRLVEYILLYGDPIKTATTDKPANRLVARTIVGERAAVVPVVNIDARHTRGLFGWQTPQKNDQLDATVTIPVPAHIPIERVVEVTASGFQPIAHSVDGNTVTIAGIDIVDARVFLIGAEDAEPPSPPTGLNTAPDANTPGNLVLNWRQPFDDTGIMGYKVYRDGEEIADVRTPILSIPAPAGDCPPVYSVRAYDGDGNLSASSVPLALSPSDDPLDFRFEVDGDPMGWSPLNDISAFAVADGVLSITVFDGPNSPPGIVDAYMANANINLDADTFDSVRVRLRNLSPNTGFEFFWQNQFAGWAQQGQSGGIHFMAFNITANDADFKEYTWNLKAINASWEGIIDNLRIDPANGTQGGTILIDRIQFFDSSAVSPAWNFTRDGEHEGWNEPAQSNRIGSFTTQEGRLTASIAPGATAPHITSPLFQAQAASNRYAILRVRNLVGADQVELYYASPDLPSFGPARRVALDLAPGDTSVQEFVVDMQGRVGWNGTINRLRLAFPGAAQTGQVQVESVRLAADTTPNAAPLLLAPEEDAEADAGVAILLPAPISACDPDSEGGDIQIAISAGNGVVALGDLGAARLVSGSTPGPAVTVRGSETAINAVLLQGIGYTSDPAFDGIDSVDFLLDDMGNGRPGGPQAASASVQVVVTGPDTQVGDWLSITH